MNCTSIWPAVTALPKRRKSVRRAEILAAARAVFLEHPYEQASITQIAERAGCVVGTIYGYFENKRELFDAVLTAFYDELIADIEPRFAVIEGTADRLRFLVARHLQITLDDPSWLKLLAREARGDRKLLRQQAAPAEPALCAVRDAHADRRHRARRAARRPRPADGARLPVRRAGALGAQHRRPRPAQRPACRGARHGAPAARRLGRRAGQGARHRGRGWRRASPGSKGG